MSWPVAARNAERESHNRKGIGGDPIASRFTSHAAG